jgi:hypothetical protein
MRIRRALGVLKYPMGTRIVAALEESSPLSSFSTGRGLAGSRGEARVFGIRRS